MNQIDKTSLKPLYSEFQGYLAQAPKLERANEIIPDKSLWNHFNKAVDLLIKATGKQDYDRFKVEPEGDQDYSYISVNTYRQKLSGLISRLHVEYFSNEPAPFSGMPSTVITQTQNQSMHVQMLLNIQETIVRALEKPDVSEEQKGFLNKLKSRLDSISNATELVKQILNLGKDFGLTIGQILNLFGG